ncbi:MAG: CBS domain-containing protein [Pseudomonadota bacterium]
MKIRDYLKNIRQVPVTCRLSNSAQTAATLMADANIGAMPVIDEDGHLVGMISERDIANNFARHGTKVVDLTVADMLTKSVIFMGPNASLHDGYMTMRNHNFRHVPIVERGQVIGMISIRDVLEQYALDVGALEDSTALNPAGD